MKNTALATRKINFHITQSITERLSIKAKPKDYFIYDTEVKGFWIKVPANKTESATYIVNGKPKGTQKTIRRTIGKVNNLKAKDARVVAKEWLHQIYNGIDPKEAIQEAHAKTAKLNDVFEAYITHNRKLGKMGERSEQNYRNDMAGMLNPLMRKEVARISDKDISQWYLRNTQERPTATDRAYRELRAVLNKAVADKLIKDNPADSLTRTKQRVTIKPRQNYLKDSECGILIAEMPLFREQHPLLLKQTNLMIFMLLTGLRKENAYNLKWGQVKLRDSITIDTTKNGESYHLPLVPLINDLLEQQREITPEGCPYVFPNKYYTGPITDTRKALRKLYEQAGLEQKSNHDLRRTFSSLADMAGVKFGDIKHLMIHKKKDITEKYIQSQTQRASDNYKAIIEHLASVAPFGTGTDKDGEHKLWTTPDILRYLLFNKGKFAKLTKDEVGDAMVVSSKVTYDNEQKEAWD